MHADPNRCSNCDAELHGEYCAACGQRQVDLERPFREVIAEGLSAFLAFDTRLIRTLRPLIRRPGFLTEEYLVGHRARYVHPFKLYFAFSLIFFFVFSMSTYSIIHTEGAGIVTIRTDEAVTPDEPKTSDQGSTDDVSIVVDDESAGWFNEFFAPLDEMAESDPEGFDRLFLNQMSKSLIVLVPIVALLLQALYWKPRYVAHFVFSLHLHCFSFFVLMAGAFVDGAFAMVTEGEGTVGNNLATIAIVVYAFLALRRVYGQGRLTTCGKLIVLLLGYCIALVMTMLVTLVITIATF